MRLVRLLSGESLVLFVAATIASIISGVSTMVVLRIIFGILHQPASLRRQEAGFIAIAVLALVSRGFAQAAIGHISRKSMMGWRRRLADLIVGAPLKDLERIGTSPLIASLTSDVATIASALPNFVRFGANLSFALACLAYLVWLSPEKFGLTASVLVLGIVLYYLLQQQGLKHLRTSRELWDQLLASFRVLVDGAKELKLHPLRRRRSLERFYDLAHNLRISARNQSIFFGGAASGMQLLLFAALGLAIFSSTSDELDRGLLISYAVSIIYLVGPLRSITESARAFHEAEVALDRLQKLDLKLEGGGDSKTSPSSAWQPSPVKSLRLNNVTHSYRGNRKSEQFALGPIDATFREGQIVFIVGGNGSGKTTLAKILTGLYMPENGFVELNNQRIDNTNIEHYRRCFSTVFSDYFLFEDVLGDVEDADRRATALLVRMQIADKVEVEAGCFSRVTSLSHGERKRLALTLCCLDDRPIFLFDEWSAEQDPIFKDIFYREILPDLRSRGKLVFVISHDDRYFAVADEIVTLERGRAPSFKAAPEQAFVS